MPAEDGVLPVLPDVQLEAAVGEDPEEEIPVQIFVVSGEKDIKLAEMLLKENNISYKKGN